MFKFQGKKFNTRCMITVLLCILLVPFGIPFAISENSGLTDMKGRVFSVPTPVERIVALAPSDCEILYALGVGDLLVGRGLDCDYPPDVQQVSVVTTGATTNIEEIIALQPQVVLMNTMAQTLEQVDALQAAGISVVATESKDISGMYENIRLLGALTNRVEEADSLIQQMMESFASIALEGDANEGKTVYFEVSPLQYGLWTAGKGTFMDEIATLCGLTNCFQSVEGWAQISEEQVISANPDYIVTLSPNMENAIHPVDEIKCRTGWEIITAVRNDTILLSEDNSLVRPAPRLTDAAHALLLFTFESNKK